VLTPIVAVAVLPITIAPGHLGCDREIAPVDSVAVGGVGNDAVVFVLDVRVDAELDVSPAAAGNQSDTALERCVTVVQTCQVLSAIGLEAVLEVDD